MLRGYLAMLVVVQAYRGAKLGTTLARMAIDAMQERGCEEVVLEAELSNKGALALYENLGFVRDKRLHKYVGVGTTSAHKLPRVTGII